MFCSVVAVFFEYVSEIVNVLQLHNIAKKIWVSQNPGGACALPCTCLRAPMKRSQLIFVCNFVINQQILMVDLEVNGTYDSMNFTHLT